MGGEFIDRWPMRGPGGDAECGRMMMNEHDYVGVLGDAKTVYVLIAERKKFDDIPLPVKEQDDRVQGNGRVLSKMLETPELWVIFQHWLEDLDAMKNG